MLLISGLCPAGTSCVMEGCVISIGVSYMVGPHLQSGVVKGASTAVITSLCCTELFMSAIAPPENYVGPGLRQLSCLAYT